MKQTKKYRSVQSSVTPKGYTKKNYNKWISYIAKTTSKLK